jgi:Zn-dependent protease
MLTSLLLFASIVTHELAHSILAIRDSISVKDIALFVFGGISQITKEATYPRAELSIAIVGPLTSLTLAGIFYGLHLLLSGTQQALAASLMQWLALINVVLAVFNLIPGFPLDGSRIFRAVVWHRTHDYHRATRIATRVEQGVAYAFIAIGIASYPEGIDAHVQNVGSRIIGESKVYHVPAADCTRWCIQWQANIPYPT